MQVYKLTFPDNSIYVGATTKTALERLKNHYEARNAQVGKNKLIRQAFFRYGLNVKIDVLCECDNKELLLLAEMEAIEKHNSFNGNNPLGLNMVRGGVGIKKQATLSEYKKDWCERNNDRLLEKKKAYYQENKERLKASAKDNHEKNKERNNERNRKYAREHKEEIGAYHAEYQRINREKVNEKNRLWRLSRTPEQKAEIAAKAKQKKDANREEINRKERERRKAKRELLKQNQ